MEITNTQADSQSVEDVIPPVDYFRDFSPAVMSIIERNGTELKYLVEKYKMPMSMEGETLSSMFDDRMFKFYFGEDHYISCFAVVHEKIVITYKKDENPNFWECVENEVRKTRGSTVVVEASASPENRFVVLGDSVDQNNV